MAPNRAKYLICVRTQNYGYQNIFRKSSLNSKILVKKLYPFIVKKSEEIEKNRTAMGKEQEKTSAPRNIFGKIVLNSKMLAKNFYSLFRKKSEEIEK